MKKIKEDERTHNFTRPSDSEHQPYRNFRHPHPLPGPGSEQSYRYRDTLRFLLVSAKKLEGTSIYKGLLGNITKLCGNISKNTVAYAAMEEPDSQKVEVMCI